MGIPNIIPKRTQLKNALETLNGNLTPKIGSISWLNARLTNTPYSIPIRYLLNRKNFILGNIRKKNRVKEKAIK